MTTTTIYAKWLIERFGSMAAVDAWLETADIKDEARLQREWQLAVCEEAGIPYSGWTADALRCARARMADRDSEISTVRTLNDLHNRAPKSALDHWLHHLAGYPSAYA